MATYNLAELFELVVDRVPKRTALVTDRCRLAYSGLDERANRLAHHLADAGIGWGDHVGLHLQNGNEYLEGMLAAYKLRAVPININYRYVERELEQLYSTLDLVGLLIHRQFAPSVRAVIPRVEALRHVLVVEDGSDERLEGATPYEDALSAASPARDFVGRASDDMYCACTGGTTGLPKGVLWRHEDIFFAAMGGGDLTMLQGPITEPVQLADRVLDIPLVAVVTPPLMHVSAHWSAFVVFFGGGTLVLPKPGPLDPAEVWRLVAEEHANVLIMVGNAMANPLLDHYAARPTDASSLSVIASGGAILSASTKRRLRELLPHVMIADGFGSTETGVASTGGGDDARGGRSTFRMDDTTAVFDQDLKPVVPGSGVAGRMARRGRIPLGYYNEPEKTAEVFKVIDGVRWVLSGDMATVDEDGMVVLHGRGSTIINTGGEKVFPEEVESAIIGHPAVADVLVVGVPDERWGERVAAVVTLHPRAELDLEGLQAYCRDKVAGYKVPRQLSVVPEVQRQPTGKPDYTWAREAALAPSEPDR